MAIYENLSHLYITWRYQAKQGNTWQGETYQSGLRVIVSDSVYATNAGRVDPDFNWGVQDAAVLRDTTNWEVQQGFSGVTLAGQAITDADVDALADAVGTYLLAVKGLGSIDYEFESIRMYPIASSSTTGATYGNSATAPTIFFPKTTNYDPNGSGLLPPEVAAVISTQSVVRGPSGRGRWYVGGLNKLVLAADGIISSANQTAFTTSGLGLIDNIRAIDNGVNALRFTPAIWSKNATQTGSADTFSIISKIRVNDELDVQRRRQRQRTPVWEDANVT